MFMDSNDDYDSPAGPLIAAFHLHHKTPLYKKNNILLVYFNESGAKNWLVGYLLIAVILISTSPIHPVLSYIMVYFGILSSVAEVSHYLLPCDGFKNCTVSRDISDCSYRKNTTDSIILLTMSIMHS